MPYYDPEVEDALPSVGDLRGPPADPPAAAARVRRDMGLPGGQPPAAPVVRGLRSARRVKTFANTRGRPASALRTRGTADICAIATEATARSDRT